MVTCNNCLTAISEKDERDEVGVIAFLDSTCFRNMPIFALFRHSTSEG